MLWREVGGGGTVKENIGVIGERSNGKRDSGKAESPGKGVLDFVQDSSPTRSYVCHRAPHPSPLKIMSTLWGEFLQRSRSVHPPVCGLTTR